MYQLNLELTKEIYNNIEIREMVNPNDCYYNIFKVASFSYLRSKFENGEYKVALSYVDVGLQIWVRHCIIVTDKNEVIDLTLLAGRSDSDRKYDIVKVFDYEEYHNKIEEAYDEKEGNYRCDLFELEEEYNFYKERKSNDESYQLNEYDFFNYIIPLLNKYENFLGLKEAF